mmetsp:Transcript_24070/g.67580  ORF Transcript_24070/g.67580 Transcript_24070/m.67580 type:complete len:200 (+) Transcript_24070:1751-2350(+)
MFNSLATIGRGLFKSFASLNKHDPMAATCALTSASARNTGVSFWARVRSCGVLTSCQPPKMDAIWIDVPSSTSNCRNSQRLAWLMGSSHHGRPFRGEDKPVEERSAHTRAKASSQTGRAELAILTNPANSPSASLCCTRLFLPMRRTMRLRPSPAVMTTSTSSKPLLWLPGASWSTTTASWPVASASTRATLGRKMMSP